MADTLQDVVQHVTDGALAQGYITQDQVQAARDAAARGERPEIDLSAAPQSMRDAADAVLNQAATLHEADVQRAEEGADLHERWADHQGELNDLRADANEMKQDLKDLETPIAAAESEVQQAQALLDGKPTLADALVNDTDLENYRAVGVPAAEAARPHIGEAFDHLAEARTGLVDLDERLIDGLQRADRLEPENSALWVEQNAHDAAQAQSAQSWTVLEGQADDAFATATDSAAHTDPGHEAAHTAEAHIEPAAHVEAADVEPAAP